MYICGKEILRGTAPVLVGNMAVYQKQAIHQEPTTPASHKGEFSDKKRGKYTHKKTKWKFEKSKDGHYNGEHWHAYPENAQTGDYYNISPDGRVLS